MKLLIVLSLIAVVACSSSESSEEKKKKFCHKYIDNDVIVCLKGKPTCVKPNEVFSTCGANSCQNTCVNPTFADTCTADCTAGCVCKSGYIRNAEGSCILTADCPPNCLLNEEASACGANTCQNTCAAPTLSATCTDTCTKGCVCKSGYFRDAQGVCILIADCPPTQATCGYINEDYSACGANSCQNTCDQPTLDDTCTADCTEGCVCKSGYFRNSQGICTLFTNCPPSPGKCAYINEEYSACGANACQNTCAAQTLSATCTAPCTEGCVCKTGYVRNAQGVCILTANCPPPCTWDYCKNLIPPCPVDEDCSDECFPKCFCRHGFLTNIPYCKY